MSKVIDYPGKQDLLQQREATKLKDPNFKKKVQDWDDNISEFLAEEMAEDENDRIELECGESYSRSKLQHIIANLYEMG